MISLTGGIYQDLSGTRVASQVAVTTVAASGLTAIPLQKSQSFSDFGGYPEENVNKIARGPGKHL